MKLQEAEERAADMLGDLKMDGGGGLLGGGRRGEAGERGQRRSGGAANEEVTAQRGVGSDSRPARSGGAIRRQVEEEWMERVRVLGQEGRPRRSLAAGAGEALVPPSGKGAGLTVFLRSLGRAVEPTIVVDAEGSGDFKKIQDALDAVTPDQLDRTVIYVKNGFYKEKAMLEKDRVRVALVGESATGVVLSWDDTAQTIDPQDPMMMIGTFASATFAATADFFVLERMTLENSAPQPRTLPNGEMIGGQSVAYRVSGDNCAHYEVRFLSWQDTLYDYSGNHYFWNCYIEGQTDFIFGMGISIYEHCLLYCKDGSYVTANGRQTSDQQSAFVFNKCVVAGEPGLLGRAWRLAARVIFANSWLDPVAPEGWALFDDNDSTDEIYYGEYQNVGPGADTSGRVSWSLQLTKEQVAPFLDISFIGADGWQPLVPPFTGLAFRPSDGYSLNKVTGSLLSAGTPFTNGLPGSTSPPPVVPTVASPPPLLPSPPPPTALPPPSPAALPPVTPSPPLVQPPLAPPPLAAAPPLLAAAPPPANEPAVSPLAPSLATPTVPSAPGPRTSPSTFPASGPSPSATPAVPPLPDAPPPGTLSGGSAPPPASGGSDSPRTSLAVGAVGTAFAAISTLLLADVLQEMLRLRHAH